MHSQKTLSRGIFPETDIRNIYQAFLIPQLISILKEIMEDVILYKITVQTHTHYKQAVELLHSIPLDEFKIFNEPENLSIAQIFVEAGFIAGLDYLKNDAQIIEKKFNNKYVTMSKAITNSFSKEPLHWLINYFKSKENYKLFDNPLTKAVLEQDIKELQKAITNFHILKCLAIRDELYPNLLEEACWMGKIEIVKILCEKMDNRQFDWIASFEASLQSGHHDIVFYLLDKILRQKSFALFIQLLFQMVTSVKFISPGNYGLNGWYFRQEFAEECIVYLLNHATLSPEEKSAVVKLPVLYLLMAFPYYSKESFEKVFGSALLLLEKNLPVPNHIREYIKNYTKSSTTTMMGMVKLDPSFGIQPSALNVYEFSRNPVIDITLTTTLRSTIYAILSDSGNCMTFQYKYFLHNLNYYENFLPHKLFLKEILPSLQNEALKNNKLSLFNYFGIVMIQDYDTFNILKSIETLIQQINFDSDERIVSHPVWGKGPQKCINYFETLKFLLDKIESSQEDYCPSYMGKVYESLSDLIKIGVDTDLFFNEINSAAAGPLLSRFVQLGYKLSQIVTDSKIHLSLDLLLPIFLKWGRINNSIISLKHLSHHCEKFTFNKPMYGLILICVHIMDRVDIHFDRSQNQAWYSKTDDTQQLINVCLSPFLAKKNQVITNVRSIDRLIEEILSVRRYLSVELFLQKKEKIILKIDYLTECMQLCDVLVHWANMIRPEKSIETDQLHLLKILKLKGTLLQSVSYFLKQLPELKFVMEHDNKIEKIGEKQESLVKVILNRTQEIKTAIQKINDGFFNIKKLPSFFPVSIDAIKRYNQFNLQNDLYANNRAVKVHPDTYPKDPKVAALNLEPSSIIAVKWYCDAISALYNKIKTCYENNAQHNYAKEAESCSFFYSDYRNHEKFEFDSLVKTLRDVYNLLEDFFPHLLKDQPAQRECKFNAGRS